MPVSDLRSLPNRLAVVCHDAGAANIIFEWMRALRGRRFRVLVQGPALSLWTRRPVPDAVLCDTLTDALDGVDAVLSGTGWASELEHEARVAAQASGLRSLAVIDHWVNYAARFERTGLTVLPDCILVTDAHAASLAARTFPGHPITEYPNLYLEQTVRLIPPVSPADNDILYVLEPIRASWVIGQAGEFHALDFFAEHLHFVVREGSSRVRLRPHPSDAVGKYDLWISTHPDVPCELDQSPSLEDAIGRARWVVGAETFAMVVGLAAGRKVLSTLPPWAHRCRLPHPEIMHLRDLIG